MPFLMNFELDEAIRCDRQLNISQPQEDEDHKIRIFTLLVLQGKSHESTRWITEKSNKGFSRLMMLFLVVRVLFNF